jgi:hypothetical protein
MAERPLALLAALPLRFASLTLANHINEGRDGFFEPLLINNKSLPTISLSLNNLQTFMAVAMSRS